MRLKIAILGTRGIPANYGGFETFAEELGIRLVERDHDVTVYGRSHYIPDDVGQYRGIKVQRLPALRQKYLETVSHTILSVVDAFRREFDIILMCNAANALFCPIPRLRGCRVVLNVDGIERLRKKWNAFGRAYYFLSERLSTWFPNVVVTDARSVQSYYLQRYHCDSSFIPYGATVQRIETRKILRTLNLEPNHYFLYVSRLEPENNAERVLQAYLRTRSDIPLALIGDAPYNRRYIDRLRKLAEGKNVRMPGAVYGTGYRELLAGCLCYLHATEVGGTHPALIEAMGAGCVVIVHDTPENREVVADTGILLDFEDTESLARTLIEVSRFPEKYTPLGARARRRVQEYYDWEMVVDQYERLFFDLLKAPGKFKTIEEREL